MGSMALPEIEYASRIDLFEETDLLDIYLESVQ